MNTIKLSTVEGHEIEMAVADHAKLLAWPDVDLSRIHVLRDDDLHAIQRSTGRPHPMTLEAMLRVPHKDCPRCNTARPIFAYPKGRSTCKPCLNLERRARRAALDATIEASLVAPVTGEPMGMLKRYAEKLAAKG